MGWMTNQYGQVVEAIVKGRKYRVEKTGEAYEHPKLAADLIARGFDGCCYLLHGVRGAARLAYRNERTGQFVIAC
jgi:hypothetical protein